MNTMNRRAMLWLSTAAVAAAGGGYWYWKNGNLPASPLGSVSAQEAKNIDTSGIAEMTIGSPDAKVHMIEYGSFTCPHCKHWHDEVWPQVKKNYIDTGKVSFTFREVYFDRFGLWAAMMARCGGPMKYFGIVDIIYDTQTDWTKGEPAEIAQNLQKIGRSAGITDEQLSACMADNDTAQKLVALYQKQATADGVEGTPTFFIDGKKYSNMGYDEFARALDEALAAKG
jgi:protein-disulfide isomerase